MASMKERMLAGDPYFGADPELVAERARTRTLLERYNETTDTDVLREILGELGEDVVVMPTFLCDYGYNISIGARTFVNYDCIMLDVVPIRIGAACQLATRVQLLAATHPIDPEPRRQGWESGSPI